MSTFILNKIIRKIGLLNKRSTILLAKKHTDNNFFNHIINYNDNRPYGYKELLCLAPSTALYFNLYGDVLACCKNTISKLGNVKNQSIVDIWNSAERSKLVESIQSYALDANGCIGCKNSIITGQYNSVLARMYDRPFINKPDNTFPLDITFEISNTCNLECKMCNAEYSSSIRLNRDHVPKLYNPYPDNFLDQLSPFLEHVKVLRFQGGEPFLINIYLDIIDMICKVNPSCKMYIQTNGTILNERVKKIISLENLHLSISIDSLKKENYEWTRKNANFLKLMENINSFKDIVSQKNKKININMCLMRHNWYEIPDFLNFCDENKFSLNVIPIEYPEVLSIGNLSPEQIDEILHFYKEYLSKTKHKTIIQSIINSILNYKNISIEREILLHQLTEKELPEIESAITRHLNPYLSVDDIQKLIEVSKKKLENLDLIHCKTVLANTLLDYRSIGNLEEDTSDKEKRVYNEFLYYLDLEVYFLKGSSMKTL